MKEQFDLELFYMRGQDIEQSAIFSYVSPEKRVPENHPLRTIRQLTDEVLKQLSPLFTRMYAKFGRPSVPPEKLLRALLLQMLYTVRSERMLMEQLEYNLLFRWFVGLGMDDAVWNVTVFSKNRDRLLKANTAQEFLGLVVAKAQALNLMSDEHFTVDGTLLEACASLKSFKRIARPILPGREAIPQWISVVRNAAMKPMRRRRTRMRCWLAKARAKKPSSAIAGTC
jgi:transposase